jgi:hypothetical protein
VRSPLGLAISAVTPPCRHYANIPRPAIKYGFLPDNSLTLMFQSLSLRSRRLGPVVTHSACLADARDETGFERVTPNAVQMYHLVPLTECPVSGPKVFSPDVGCAQDGVVCGIITIPAVMCLEQKLKLWETSECSASIRGIA